MQLQHGISGSVGLCAGTLGIGKPAVFEGSAPGPQVHLLVMGIIVARPSKPRNDLTIYLVSASYLIHQHFHINE